MTVDAVTPAILAAIKSLFGSAFVYVRGYDSNPDPNAHHGIDLAAARGTPVRAVHGGTIIYAANAGSDLYGNNASPGTPWWNFGGGNVVDVSIPNLNGASIAEQYAHLDSMTVRSGQSVNAGDIIGYVGSTGDATGPHLHFATFDLSAKKWVDPVPYLLLAQQGLGGSLSFWNGWVSFANGHVLTAADVDSIMSTLDSHHAFDVNSNIPLFGPIVDFQASNTARDKTRSILMTHVGEAWTPALAVALQTQFFGAASTAGTNPLSTIATLLGKAFDPGTWIRILALLLGAIMFLYGGANVLKATG